MSWDLTVGDDEFNYTHNCNPMIRAAGFTGWWDAADGMTGAELAARLRDVIRQLLNRPEKYRAMNPANGWGSYDSLVAQLVEVQLACSRQPSAIVEVS